MSKKKRPLWYGVLSGPTIATRRRSIRSSNTRTKMDAAGWE